MTPAFDDTISQRQEADKATVLGYLRKVPIVQIACKRSGIARATYYRWRTDDPAFKAAADQAMRDGELFVNDLSESQVITLIEDRNWPAISFWLRHHHPTYADKLKLETSISHIDESLSLEEQKLVEHALICLRGTSNAKLHE